MHKIVIPQYVRDRVVQRQGKLHAYEVIDTATSALIVVDMQNYFMQEGQQGEVPVARAIVPTVNRMAHAMRDAGGCVVWVQTSAEGTLESWSHLHQDLYLPERRDRRLASMREDAVGFQLWAALDVRAADERVIKKRYSAFIPGSSKLEALLRTRGIDMVLIAGTMTNVCCESTARDAMMLNFKTIMLSDATASLTEEEHNGAIANVLLYFGDVLTVDEAIARLKPVEARPIPARGSAP